VKRFFRVHLACAFAHCRYFHNATFFKENILITHVPDTVVFIIFVALWKLQKMMPVIAPPEAGSQWGLPYAIGLPPLVFYTSNEAYGMRKHCCQLKRFLHISLLGNLCRMGHLRREDYARKLLFCP
jgi:hypothetical protein